MTLEDIIEKTYSAEDAKRIEKCLDMLLPYLTPFSFIIVGGLAIRYHITNGRMPYPLRPFNDVDMLIPDETILSPAVTKDFLVAHYHSLPKTEFYIVLVQPETKTKVDVFSFQHDPYQTILVPYKNYHIKIPSIEDQLVKTVLDIQRISQAEKVDPKQFQDTKILTKIADTDIINKYWKQKQFEKWPANILDAIARAEKIAEVHPEWIQEKPFRRHLSFECSDCIHSPNFPLTPLKKIYRILGYIK